MENTDVEFHLRRALDMLLIQKRKDLDEKIIEDLKNL